ncbi:Maf1-domain-containing protein [Guyanagaster necrorhizus]|uniref:Repressor of RNA polymerase III transcription MAF1 n=1 Tax=Guyanagaster necrorhizus TaxID=856835 RepID=A0A9P7W397_9AGAR|nr:Maf1-domain-containing protein [Guyanagaster necrorhizus MCA 3950]KAG7451847.1 Maf1-domain-containing protein [Guyanagaster necrorhizus MCA 3950]
MKYIDQPALSRLAQSLTHEGPECSVYTRIEVYSCKNVKRDKKLFRSLEDAYKDEAAHSPSVPSWLALDEPEMTPFGPIDKHASRKTLYLLIATLNIAFPDYEFSDVRPGHFNKEESGAAVLNALSTTLVAPHRAGVSAPRTYSSYPPTSSDFFPEPKPTSSSPVNSFLQSPYAPPLIESGTHPFIYRLLDDVIGLSECEVFSYVPEIEADPHGSDLSDDDDYPASDEAESTDEEEVFEFDDYNVDEAKSAPIPMMARRRSDDSLKSGLTRRRRGALLWSSHWFFLNRKQKRILFISVWARTKGKGNIWMGGEKTGYRWSSSVDSGSERFLGWEGATGAGARALGLTTSL